MIPTHLAHFVRRPVEAKRPTFLGKEQTDARNTTGGDADRKASCPVAAGLPRERAHLPDQRGGSLHHPSVHVWNSVSQYPSVRRSCGETRSSRVECQRGDRSWQLDLRLNLSRIRAMPESQCVIAPPRSDERPIG